MPDHNAADTLVSGPIFEAEQVTVHRLFPTPVVVAPLRDTAALNQELSARILAREQEEAGVMLSNDGGWQSDGRFVVWSGEAGAYVIEAARVLATQLTMQQTDGGLVSFTPNWKIDAWANVNRAGHANFPHSHAGAFWSGVYWVDDGGIADHPGVGGVFAVNDPRGVMPTLYAPHLRYAISGCLTAGMSDFVAPQSGHLIMFPSWLVHSVQRYHGPRPRISIAFNFSL